MKKWRVVFGWTWVIVLIISIPTAYTESDKERVYDVINELNQYFHINEERVIPDVATWLQNYNRELQQRKHEEALAEYNYLTNITTASLDHLTKVQVSNMEWEKVQVLTANEYLTASHIADPLHYRMLKLITGNTIVSNKESVNQKISKLRGDMEKIYGTTKVNGKTLDDLELEIINGTYNEKLDIWLGWRNAVGPKMRPIFRQFIDYQNLAAHDSGFANMKDAWILGDYGYETQDLEKTAATLFEDILPLYKQLHAYVRRKLFEKYSNHIDLKGPIPAHLLGNMWAQQWDNVNANVMPYPDAKVSDVTPELKKRKYTPKKMFKLAEAFFESIGLNSMTEVFWAKSMLSRPSNREVQCHASASDMYKTGDFRIKMCTNINQGDLFTIHHEMGHIQYFMEYAQQPAIFRNGANAAFHEAIGDTIALSISTPKHFETIGLQPSTNKRSTVSDQCGSSLIVSAQCKKDLNFLMGQALQKIAFLPFGYLIDKYRWRIFTGDIDQTNYNSEWWEMRKLYQGISSAVKRSENDFDPGAKYHVAANVPYNRYFFSFITQFQFYKAMCDESGHTGPIYKCDFYNSKSAGKLLKSMLKLGQSEPWQDAMETMTGQRDFNTAAIKEYFQPLEEWLVKENSKNAEYIGWI